MSSRDDRLLEVADSLERHAMMLRGLQERDTAAVLDFLVEAQRTLGNARLEGRTLDVATRTIYRGGIRAMAQVAADTPAMVHAALEEHRDKLPDEMLPR